MRKIFAQLAWLLVAALGAWAYLILAFHRGETVNSVYLLLAALCSYTIGYRFYSKWIATRVLMLDNRRATPCEVHDDGRDFVKTNKWIVFGHHFAAIAGPGPLVGPVLAAQFGYLPSALWILIGVVLGGAVQDFVILFCSLRRDGKTLGQMVREELNNTAGWIALIAILCILVILLAVLGLVVVNALADSPWGIFTVGATIPIALLMGVYIRYWRPGKVLEASAFGVVLLLLAVWGGQFAYGHAATATLLTFSREQLAWALLAYAMAASVAPIWLLLAPRDYLSTFVKLGTIALLVVGVMVVLPQLRMPALTEFITTGHGPVMAGKIFPFCFITIACGAISGFHALIASGTTPKLLTREDYARPIGYGAMCLESLVAIMALIAACTLDPGVYFSINMKGAPADTVATLSTLGYHTSVEQMQQLATMVGEKSLFGRVGGGPTLAVGMANMFSSAFGKAGFALWYHFAIMFEALFILTTIDAGTRVGRYILQDFLGHLWAPLGDTKKPQMAWLASALTVGAWGWFLIQGVRDPLGGINTLWPLFGISNQLLAAIALCLATTVILKMHLPRPSSAEALRDRAHKTPPSRPVLALVTLLPLCVLLVVTMTAGVEKIFHPDPAIGFLAAAKGMDSKLPALRAAVETAPQSGDAAVLKSAQGALRANRENHFNLMVDSVVDGAFLAMVTIFVALSVREWILLLARRKLARLRETKAVLLPDYALVEGKRLSAFQWFALVLLLLKELSSEADMDRAREAGKASCCQEACRQATEKRFTGINRCC
jgi:carbon starvation protein